MSRNGKIGQGGRVRTARVRRARQRRVGLSAGRARGGTFDGELGDDVAYELALTIGPEVATRDLIRRGDVRARKHDTIVAARLDAGQRVAIDDAHRSAGVRRRDPGVEV